METEKNIVYQSPIGKIFEKFSRHKDVSLVYGEPIKVQDKKVLPVAKVNYMVGGGGGYSEGASGQGEGGGGRITVTPLGVYEIDAQKVKFKPIIDVKLIMIFSTVFTLGLVWLVRKSCRQP